MLEGEAGGPLAHAPGGRATEPDAEGGCSSQNSPSLRPRSRFTVAARRPAPGQRIPPPARPGSGARLTRQHDLELLGQVRKPVDDRVALQWPGQPEVGRVLRAHRMG